MRFQAQIITSHSFVSCRVTSLTVQRIDKTLFSCKTNSVWMLNLYTCYISAHILQRDAEIRWHASGAIQSLNRSQLHWHVNCPMFFFDWAWWSNATLVTFLLEQNMSAGVACARQSIFVLLILQDNMSWQSLPKRIHKAALQRALPRLAFWRSYCFDVWGSR